MRQRCLNRRNEAMTIPRKRKSVARNERGKQLSVRARILANLQCRKALVVVCSLVVLECMCVMAELMVDLQGIRVRFENEEREVSNFVRYMKAEEPDAFESFDGHTLEEVLHILHKSTQLFRFENSSCQVNCDGSASSGNITSSLVNLENVRLGRVRRSADAGLFPPSINKRKILMQRVHLNGQERGSKVEADKLRMQNMAVVKHRSENAKQRISDGIQSIGNVQNLNQKQYLFSNFSKLLKQSKHGAYKFRERTRKIDVLVKRNKRSVVDTSADQSYSKKLFVFTVNTVDENFYMVSRFKDVDPKTQKGQDIIEDIKKYSVFTEQYATINKASHIIKYIGFAILTVMVVETLLKFTCLGVEFFKKKIEVFDACIVIISFALDVIFLDSRWYDTGKDATTILVLLLPWRVVRIVNSFVMTINHKHRLEMMWVRKARKKTEMRLQKLQKLTIEIRRDVDLLIALARSKGANDAEVTACIYGKGRGSTTLAAITSFAHLMLISTLGKDPRIAEQLRDDLYGDMIKEVLVTDEEDDEEVDEGGEEEEEADGLDDTETSATDLETQNMYGADLECDQNTRRVSKTFSLAKRHRNLHHQRQSRHGGSLRHVNVTRRAVIPRRCRSQDAGVYYINDAFVSPEDGGERGAGGLPVISEDRDYVAFEVTTQVTYL